MDVVKQHPSGGNDCFKSFSITYSNNVQVINITQELLISLFVSYILHKTSVATEAFTITSQSLLFVQLCFETT